MSSAERLLSAPDSELGATTLDRAISDFRGATRHDFRSMQLLAPYSGGPLPQRCIFKPVQCLDISRSGFSFLLGSPAYCKQYIIALRDQDPLKRVYLSAEVVHCTPVGCDYAPMFRIGCRFLTRLD